MIILPNPTVHPSIISSFSTESVGLTLATASTGAAPSTAWPTANLAIYIPFTITSPLVAQRLFVVNGSTASNNFDVGIYDAQGNKIVSSGSTAQSGTSNLQVITISATSFGPGTFYFALAMNGTTGTFIMHSSSAAGLAQAGVYCQSTAFALPSTATFASASGLATVVPVVGLSTITTV